MKNVMHLVGSATAAVLFVAAMVLPASAQEITLRNTVTGPGSENVNRVTIEQRSNWRTTNDWDHSRWYDGSEWARRYYNQYYRDYNNRFGNRFNFELESDVDIENTIDIEANTGGNTIRGNTIVGDIRTGDVDIRLDIENRGF